MAKIYDIRFYDGSSWIDAQCPVFSLDDISSLYSQIRGGMSGEDALALCVSHISSAGVIPISDGVFATYTFQGNSYSGGFATAACHLRYGIGSLDNRNSNQIQIKQNDNSYITVATASHLTTFLWFFADDNFGTIQILNLNRASNQGSPRLNDGTRDWGFQNSYASIATMTGATLTGLQNAFRNATPIIIDKDPYKPGGTTSTGGGTGDFDGTGDNIDIPNLPTLSATDTGFITLFNPSSAQLVALANYMWSSGFDLDTFKKLFADPMDCILGLSIVPVAVPDGSAGTVSVGNISTGVSMTKAGAQYVAVDCGTLNVNEFWGAYLDYDPYTKAEIYLPYIGTHPISVDDIMGKAVHVVYHVDILSGACCAFVKCGDSVLYSFIGQCSSSIPITGNDWTNVINGVLSIAGSIGSMVATGGASAPLAVPALAATAANGLKPNVEKSGSLSGTGGMLGIQVPYLILTRPRQALPSRQNAFTGYPSFITSKLADISGYTEIESVHLENVPATEQELSEIIALLKEGVIL